MSEFEAFENGERVLATAHTPLDDLLVGEQVSEPGSEAWRMRRELLFKLMNYFFADGETVDGVAKRAFAVAWALNHNGIKGRMTQTEMARIFGQVRATVSKRIKVQVTNFMAGRGAKGCFVPGQKSATAVDKFRRAQKKNKNRRGGKR